MDDLKDLDLDLIFDEYIPDDFDDLDSVNAQPRNNTLLNQNSNNNNNNSNSNVNNNNTHNKETEFVYGSLDDILLDDDDDFFDIDADELVKATENIERGRTPTTTAATTAITTTTPRTTTPATTTTTTAIPENLTDQTPQEELEDPTPPAPLPRNTPNFHSFDNQALCTWVYPVNYPTRTYQLNMVKKALFQNTLIALPTGLGKTFIAAVVMYNYWRWFPESKVIFLAPTRPLVTQQIEACFKICGLPQADTIEMTGNMTAPKRAENWKTKRVFFMTPQTMQNDLASRICPSEKIACLVVDEAHKATGNYAFTEVVRLLSKTHLNYRVLALTATPGSNLDNVQVVVNNLHINNIQIRTEESMDIQEYTHGKQIQRIVVGLAYTQGATGTLPRAIHTFQSKVFRPLLTELSKFNAIATDDPQKNTPFGLMMARNRFRENARNVSNYIRNKVNMTFLTCESMSRANELLCNHGIGPFVETIDGHFKAAETTREQGKGVPPNDRNIVGNQDLRQLIQQLKREMESPGFVGHPKMEKLISLLLEHFANSDENSKVMIFSSYRNSVDDICKALSTHHPMIRCSEFIGQGSGKSGAKGLKQAEQQKIVQKFKNNEVNVLVCTSIGEEGLDIGEVDLIICYDSQSSPIRMLQRMGRTGRKRKGRCVLLLTEAEEKKFNTAKETYRRVQQMIASGKLIKYYMPIPSVLPPNYRPTMARQKLTIGAYVPTEKKKRANKSDSLLYTPDGKMKDQTRQRFIKSFEADDIVLKKSVEELMDHYWPIQSFKKQKINTTLPIQKTLQKHHIIGHSRTTKLFVNMVRRMEHRILHPGQDLPSFSKASSSPLSSRTTTTTATGSKTQSKLVMPKRMKQTNDELALPAKKKKKTATLDDHFFSYMNQIGEEAGPSMLPFLENKESSKPIPSSVDELLKQVGIQEEDLLDDDFDHSDVKGKRRAVEYPERLDYKNKKAKKKPKENEEIDMNVDLGIDPGSDKQVQPLSMQSDKTISKNDDVQIEEGHSWSSMLPASPTDEQINDSLPINMDAFNDDLTIDQNQKVVAQKQKVEEEEEQENNISDNQPSINNSLDDEIHFDSFGDNFDDAIFEKMDALIGFNDDLPVVYPFDKTDMVNASSSKKVEIGFIWQHSNSPTFSKRSLELLKQKYQQLKQKKSDSLLVKMMSKLVCPSSSTFNNNNNNMIQQKQQSHLQPPQKQQQQQQQKNNNNSDDDFSFGGDYDEADFDKILKEVDINHMNEQKNTISKQKKKQPITIDDSQTSLPNTVHPTKMQEKEEEEEEVEKNQEESGFNEQNKENQDDNMQDDNIQDDNIQGDLDEVIFDWGVDDEVFVTMIENKGMDVEGDGGGGDNDGFLESQLHKSIIYSNQTPQKHEESVKSSLKQKRQQELEEEEIILASSLSIKSPVIAEKAMSSTTEPLEKTEPITKSMSLLSSFNDDVDEDNFNDLDKTVMILPEPPISENINNDNNIDKTVLIPRSLPSSTAKMSSAFKAKEVSSTLKSNQRIDLYITEGPVPDNISSQPEPSKQDEDDDDDEIVFDFDLISTQKSNHVNTEKTNNRSEKVAQEEEEDNYSSSPLATATTTKKKKKKGPILMNDDSTTIILSSPEQEEESIDSQLLTMAPPKKKKKGRLALDSEDDDFNGNGSSQHSNMKSKTSSMIRLDSQEEDDDFDHSTDRILPIPKYNRNEHSKDKEKKKQKKKNKKYIGKDGNPFFEIEAERSEDDVPTDDDDDDMNEDQEDEMDASFINDDISYMTQQQDPDDDEEEVAVNHHAFISPQGPRWMSRFHAEKWLQPQADDTIIEDDEELEDEGEMVEEVEEDYMDSFSSHHQNENGIINEDDDFM